MVRILLEILFICGFYPMEVHAQFFLVTDLYAYVIGSYVIWTALAGARYTIEHIRTKRAAVLLGQIWKWCCIVFKSSALLSIWVRRAKLSVLLCLSHNFL